MIDQRIRRYPPRAGGRRRRERDPYLFTVIVQIVLCAALLLGCLGMQRLWPEDAAGLAELLDGLLTADRVEIPSGTGVAAVSAQVRGAADSAADAVARVLTDLLTPPGDAAQPPSPDISGDGDVGGSGGGEPSAASSDPSATAEGLSGAGGWFGRGDEVGKQAPSSCAFSPILVSARVDAPTGGAVTSSFGWREHPISGAEDFHRGLDIAAAAGSGIYASLPGRVVEVDSSPIYGNYITLDHGNGLMTTYCHCESIAAPLGANLRRGELVALVGNTGISTGPHVHFEISKDGRYYNPAWVLDGMDADGV